MEGRIESTLFGKEKIHSPFLPLAPLAVFKGLLCKRIDITFILCCPQSIIQTHGARLQAILFLFKQSISLETEQTSNEFYVSRGVEWTGTCQEIIHEPA